jgi:carotenoid cleavage dioxygenase-like enzyme
MAHTKRDHSRNRLVGVEIAQGMNLGLRILEFGPDMQVLSEVPFSFDGIGAFHDFTMTVTLTLTPTLTLTLTLTLTPRKTITYSSAL